MEQADLTGLQILRPAALVASGDDDAARAIPADEGDDQVGPRHRSAGQPVFLHDRQVGLHLPRRQCGLYGGRVGGFVRVGGLAADAQRHHHAARGAEYGHDAASSGGDRSSVWMELSTLLWALFIA
ncbi:hypothetical protein MSKU3_3312 [Komagataeibacter oboediens]|nr:hypothetical protein MSKU3_3312 [Komagataeibacter oboediens]